MQKACQCLALLSTAWQCLALLSTSGLVSGGARGAMAPPKFFIFFLSGKFHEKFVRKISCRKHASAFSGLVSGGARGAMAPPKF